MILRAAGGRARIPAARRLAADECEWEAPARWRSLSGWPSGGDATEATPTSCGSTCSASSVLKRARPIRYETTPARAAQRCGRRRSLAARRRNLPFQSMSVERSGKPSVKWEGGAGSLMALPMQSLMSLADAAVGIDHFTCRGPGSLPVACTPAPAACFAFRRCRI